VAVINKGVQNSKVHRELSPHAVRQLLGYIPVVVFFVLVGLFLTWRPIQVARLIRDIERLSRLKTEMLETNVRLKLERSTLTRLDRIEKLARKEYGFIDPNKSQLIDIFIKDSAPQP
jgi:cell division protein FtsL